MNRTPKGGASWESALLINPWVTVTLTSDPEATLKTPTAPCLCCVPLIHSPWNNTTSGVYYSQLHVLHYSVYCLELEKQVHFNKLCVSFAYRGAFPLQKEINKRLLNQEEARQKRGTIFWVYKSPGMFVLPGSPRAIYIQGRSPWLSLQSTLLFLCSLQRYSSLSFEPGWQEGLLGQKALDLNSTVILTDSVAFSRF